MGILKTLEALNRVWRNPNYLVAVVFKLRNVILEIRSLFGATRSSGRGEEIEHRVLCEQLWANYQLPVLIEETELGRGLASQQLHALLRDLSIIQHAKRLILPEGKFLRLRRKRACQLLGRLHWMGGKLLR